MSNIKDVVIPEGWKIERLWNIADFYKWKGLPKKDIIEWWRYKCIHYWELFTNYKEVIKNINNFTNNNKETFLSKKNDVLMPTSDVTPNWLATASSLYENNIILGWDVLIIRNNKNNLYWSFLSYYIAHDKTQVMRLVKWSTVYHLYGSDMARFTFLLPQSIQEQEKIAEILSTVDEAIEKTDVLIEKYKKIKTWLMEDLFTKGIDVSTWKPHTKFKKSELGRIPESWGIDTIENSWIKIEDWDRWNNYPSEGDFTSNWYCVFLNNKNILNNNILYKNIQFISQQKDTLLRKWKLIDWDIVITTRGTVWNIWYYNNEYFKNVRINSWMVILRNYKTIIIKDLFINYWNHSFKSFYNVIQSWSAQPQLPIRDLYWFKFILPSIQEQEKIAEILIEADKKIEQEEAYKEKLGKIKKWLMNDLLTGAVRVEY